MGAVVLAAFAAVLLGAMAVAIRFAVSRCPDTASGAVVASAIGFIVGACAAAATHEEITRSMLLFFCAGAIAPGVSQLLFFRAIHDAGPARTAVVFGAAPLITVAFALTWLHEPLNAILIIGAVLIVAGCVSLAGESRRPTYFRWQGVLLAAVATVMFSGRDSAIRKFALTTPTAPMLALAATMLGSLTITLSYIFAIQRRRPNLVAAAQPFLPAAILFAAANACFFEAYYHGRVTVVSPLIATEALWAVALSWLLLRQSEWVSRRLLGGALLVVAGGGLIGIVR